MRASSIPNPSNRLQFFQRANTDEIATERAREAENGGHVSITGLDKVLVTSDTSEIAVYGDCSEDRGTDVVSTPSAAGRSYIIRRVWDHNEVQPIPGPF